MPTRRALSFLPPAPARRSRSSPPRFALTAIAPAATLGLALVWLMSGCRISGEGESNPVVGDAIETSAGTDETNYGLLALIAACLIVAGVLLVWVERWARRRGDQRRG